MRTRTRTVRKDNLVQDKLGPDRTTLVFTVGMGENDGIQDVESGSQILKMGY